MCRATPSVLACAAPLDFCHIRTLGSTSAKTPFGSMAAWHFTINFITAVLARALAHSVNYHVGTHCGLIGIREARFGGMAIE